MSDHFTLRLPVANNVKDFRSIAAARLASGRGHAGLILLPARRTRTRAATGFLIEAIVALVAAHPAGIADSEYWIAPPARLDPETPVEG